MKAKKKMMKNFLIGALALVTSICGGFALDNWQSQASETVSAATIPSATRAESGLSFTAGEYYEVDESFTAVPKTFEAYVKLSGTSRQGCILSSFGPNGSTSEWSTPSFSFEIKENGVPRLYYVASGSIDISFDKNLLPTNGSWVHLAIVHDGTTATCYINGEPKQTKTVKAVSHTSTNNVRVGGDHRSGNAQYFKGNIKGIECYSDVRTADEIKADYQRLLTSAPTGDNLLLAYDFTRPDGTYLNDISANGYDIDFSGDEWFSEKETTNDYAYSFAVVGDTQCMNELNPRHMDTLYDWIIANKESKKIEYVFGLGDITQSNNDEESAVEWDKAVEVIAKLDEAGIPYSLIRGNHDDTVKFNEHFNTATYKAQFQGFYEEDKIDNSWTTFTAGTTDYLLVTLDYGADDQELAWAGKVIESFPNHKVIITTHAYLYRDGTTLSIDDVCSPADSNDWSVDPYKVYNNGDQMWDKLVSQYGNIFLVLSGHDPCEDVITTQTKGVHGNTVTQMLIDPQGMDSSIGTYPESVGMVCMLYFSEDGKTIDVEWYSTVKEQYYKEKNQYSIQVYDETVEAHTATEYQYDQTSHWQVCSECGVTFGSEAHEFGEWVETEPTATTSGSRVKSCACGYQITQVLSAYEFGNYFGASIRVAEPNGIRFMLQISDAKKQEIFAKNSNLTLGMFIFPSDKIAVADGDYASLSQKLNLTFAEEDLYKVGNSWYANGVMTNVYLQNITREFIGVGYIAKTTDEGTTYVYSTFAKEENARSMLDVAIGAYNDPKSIVDKTMLFTYIEKAIYATYGIQEDRTNGVTFTDGVTTWNSYQDMKNANPISLSIELDSTLAFGESVALSPVIMVNKTAVEIDLPFTYTISENLSLKNGVLTAEKLGDSSVSISLGNYSVSEEVTVWTEIDGVTMDGVRDSAYGEFTDTTLMDDNRWYNISAVKTEKGVFIYTQALFNSSVIGDPGTDIHAVWNTSTNFEFRFNEGAQFYVNAAGQSYGVDSFIFNVEEVDGKYLHTAEIFVAKDLIASWSSADIQFNYAWMSPNEQTAILDDMIDYQYLSSWGNKSTFHAYHRLGGISTGFNEMVDNLHIGANGLVTQTSPLDGVTIDGVLDDEIEYGENELNVKTTSSDVNVKATVIDGDIYMAITITHGAWLPYNTTWHLNDNFEFYINNDHVVIMFFNGQPCLPAYFTDGATTTTTENGKLVTVLELYKEGDHDGYKLSMNANGSGGFGWIDILWNENYRLGYISESGITKLATAGAKVGGVVLDGVFDEAVYTDIVRSYSLTTTANGATVNVMGVKLEKGVLFGTTIVTTKDANTSTDGSTAWYKYTNPEIRINANGTAYFSTALNPMQGSWSLDTADNPNNNRHLFSFCKAVDNGDGTYTHTFEYFIHYADLGISAKDTVKFAVGGWYETGWKWLYGGNATTMTHTLADNGGVLELYEKMSNSEFYSQVAAYGSPSNQTSKTRARISFSVKMMKGTKFTFAGDPSVYGWAINEVANPSTDYPKSGSEYDSGWISGKTYSTKFDLYPVIVLKKMDGSSFAENELMALHALFQVDGYKISPITADNEGLLTTEEYNAQFAHFGSVPGPVGEYRARISFAIALKAGATVTYNGNSTFGGWAVVESTDTASTKYLKDSGWISGNTYTTVNDGYIVLTLKKSSKFERADFGTLHSNFTVVGEKIPNFEVVPSNDYAINSVAHRGYSTVAPENTLSAYKLAAQNGFNTVECDVEFTKDGVPVLLHDATVDRTSNGTGNIADLTLEEVRALDFGSWKSELYAGEQIPTFAEFIALCKELNLHPYIEIKNTISADYAKTLYDIVANAEMQDNVTWISFSATSLGLIKDLDDTARLGYVVSDVTATTITTATGLKTENNEVFIDCYYSLDSDDVSLCKNAGFALEVWTVDKSDTLLALDEYVSGVTSNWLVAGLYLG